MAPGLSEAAGCQVLIEVAWYQVLIEVAWYQVTSKAGTGRNSKEGQLCLCHYRADNRKVSSKQTCFYARGS